MTHTHAELDLTHQTAVADFFQTERPDYMILAAAKVGGIHANKRVSRILCKRRLIIAEAFSPQTE